LGLPSGAGRSLRSLGCPRLCPCGQRCGALNAHSRCAPG
jgi:hypothetical protein